MSEIEKILKLLEEGKISAEEAYRLIEAVKGKEKGKQKGEAFSFFDIGKVVTDAVRTAFSAVPVAVRAGFTHRTLSESIELGDLEKLNINVTVGDINLKTGEGQDLKIKGDGNYTYKSGVLTVAGDLDIEVPQVRELVFKANAGDIDGKLEGEKITLELKAGDGSFVIKAKEFDVGLKMGDLDVDVISPPEYGEIHCEMGDLTVHLPEEYDGIVEANVAMGSLDVKKGNYKKQGDDFIFGSGEKSKIKVYCKMGDIDIR